MAAICKLICATSIKGLERHESFAECKKNYMGVAGSR
jgi:hypothetical protein